VKSLLITPAGKEKTGLVLCQNAGKDSLDRQSWSAVRHGVYRAEREGEPRCACFSGVWRCGLERGDRQVLWLSDRCVAQSRQDWIRRQNKMQFFLLQKFAALSIGDPHHKRKSFLNSHMRFLILVPAFVQPSENDA